MQAVKTQVLQGNAKGGEGKRLQEEFKAKEEKKKEAAQKLLLQTLFKGITNIQ